MDIPERGRERLFFFFFPRVICLCWHVDHLAPHKWPQRASKVRVLMDRASPIPTSANPLWTRLQPWIFVLGSSLDYKSGPVMCGPNFPYASLYIRMVRSSLWVPLGACQSLERRMWRSQWDLSTQEDQPNRSLVIVIKVFIFLQSIGKQPFVMIVDYRKQKVRMRGKLIIGGWISWL